MECFGHRKRSEFLRLIVRDYQARLRVERLTAFRDAARAEREGRIYSADEVLELIHLGS